MDYREHLATHRRLALLRLLSAAAGYTANASLLTDAVNDLGITSTRDQVISELTWLQEQGLVLIETIAGVTVVTITERGTDVANGRVVVPGVKKPSPGQ
jgi:Fe2+ or Zn2+ uptake regulation protein